MSHARRPRHESFDPQDPVQDAAFSGSANSAEALAMHGERAPSPEAALMAQDQRQVLDHCLAALPAEFREVIVLKDLEGLSYKEIGTIVEVPLGTVMSRLFRGRALLHKALTGRMRGKR
jgi:RNA polymerase sigma factor (sigma-70 family)